MYLSSDALRTAALSFMPPRQWDYADQPAMGDGFIKVVSRSVLDNGAQSDSF